MARHALPTRITGILWAPLALLVALPVGALERVPAPGSRSAGALLAQAKPEIPAEVRGWVIGAVGAYNKGDPAEALRLLRKALEWAMARLGPAHPFRAEVLDKLGMCLSALGRPKEALAPTEEAVRVFREVAKTNPAYLGDLGRAMDNLGSRYSALGRRQEALAPTEEAVGIFREVAKRNPAYLGDLAGALNNLGNIYSTLDRHHEELAATEEEVKIRRELTKGSSDALGLADLARALRNLGIGYSELGRQQEELASTEEAVKIYRALPKTNPAVLADQAAVLGILAKHYSDLGCNQEAVASRKEQVKILRELASTNPAKLDQLGGALTNLGVYFSNQGRLPEALPPSEEAVSILRKAAQSQTTVSASLARALNNLGLRYSDLGRIPESQALIAEAVAMFRRLATTNPDSMVDLARGLNNLGKLHGELGQYKEALAPSIEAIKIFRELAKTNSVYLADLEVALTGLSGHLSNLSRYQEAIAPVQEAVGLKRKFAKTNSLYPGTALSNLGLVLSQAGRRQEALAPMQEAVGVLRELTKNNLTAHQMLALSISNLAVVQIQLGNPTAAVPLLREAMASEARFLQQQLPLMAESRRKAMVDTLGRRWQQTFSLANQGNAGADLALFTRLNRHAPLQDIERRQGITARASGPARGVLDRLQVLTTQLATPSLPIDKRQQAETETEQLQRELVRLLPEFQPRLVEPSAVAQQLPSDGLLLEFQRFAPYDPRQPEGQQWGGPRYLALLLAPSGQMQSVDLGPAAALEQRITTALQRTRDQVPEAAASWGQVADAVFGPLQSALVGRRRLLISPDGELHRVPFSALALLAASSNALPAGVTLQTIGSGRDLVPVQGGKPQATAPLVLADPATTGWTPLASTKEAIAVAESLRVPLLQGPAARVGVLEQARGPRIIHVAGHGYFDDQAKGDPLLASGLVLAGADMARWPSRVAASVSPDAAPRDDGYLTAKEAARLQLDGTELVVLSACETGLGVQRTGEGVFGLQRALTVAGARGTLLSLWKVPNLASQTFMERFYVLLNQGMAPDQAVRQVQEEFRSQPTIGGKPKAGAWSDPFYWAAWQYSGVPK